MAPFLTAAFLFSTPVPGHCGRAYDAVVELARREDNFGYAREVAVEGRHAFVRSCRRHLTPAQLRCILRARSSDELYRCTP